MPSLSIVPTLTVSKTPNAQLSQVSICYTQSCRGRLVAGLRLCCVCRPHFHAHNSQAEVRIVRINREILDMLRVWRSLRLVQPR